MIFVKSFLTGLAALIVVALLGILFLSVQVEMSSGGAVGAVAGPGWPILAVSFPAFAVGFIWRYRRGR